MYAHYHVSYIDRFLLKNVLTAEKYKYVFRVKHPISRRPVVFSRLWQLSINLIEKLVLFEFFLTFSWKIIYDIIFISSCYLRPRHTYLTIIILRKTCFWNSSCEMFFIYTHTTNLEIRDVNKRVSIKSGYYYFFLFCYTGISNLPLYDFDRVVRRLPFVFSVYCVRTWKLVYTYECKYIYIMYIVWQCCQRKQVKRTYICFFFYHFSIRIVLFSSVTSMCPLQMINFDPLSRIINDT